MGPAWVAPYPGRCRKGLRSNPKHLSTPHTSLSAPPPPLSPPRPPPPPPAAEDGTYVQGLYETLRGLLDKMDSLRAGRRGLAHFISQAQGNKKKNAIADIRYGGGRGHREGWREEAAWR